MTILITGKTGTVGRNLPAGEGYPSHLYDLRKENDTIELFTHIKPEKVIHLAARVGGLGTHIKYKKDLFYDNMQINMNVIEAARLVNVSRVLSFLSSCIYSDKIEQPYNESDIHTDEPFETMYPYGYAKRMLEVQSRIYYEQYDLKYNCVIPTNIYGIYDDFNLENGHVIGVLIHKTYLAKKLNTDLCVWGDGSQEREFLFTDDVKRLTYWALDNYLDKEPLIFSNNELVSVKKIVEIITSAFDFKGNIIFDTDQPSGQIKRSLDGGKLRKLLPNFKFTPIEEGIYQTIKWFVENYEIKVRK